MFQGVEQALSELSQQQFSARLQSQVLDADSEEQSSIQPQPPETGQMNAQVDQLLRGSELQHQKSQNDQQQPPLSDGASRQQSAAGMPSTGG